MFSPCTRTGPRVRLSLRGLRARGCVELTTKSPSTAQFEAQQLKKDVNKLQKEIGLKMKVRPALNTGMCRSFVGPTLTAYRPRVREQNKENADELKAQKAELDAQIAALDAKAQETETTMRKKGNTIGNIVHPSVPVSDNEVRGPSGLERV